MKNKQISVSTVARAGAIMTPAKTALLLAVLFAVGVPLLQCIAAEKPQIRQTTRTFGVRLGATRVIYDPDSVGQTLSVDNPQDYPMLVQSRAYSEDMKNRAPFVITPPLFRLDGLQQSSLRIVRVGGDFPKDRETLQWLCVKGIPPKAGDLWAQDKSGKPEAGEIGLNLQLSIDSCIKLFVRPGSIHGHPDDVASSLAWSRQGDHLKAVNDSPFYMNLASLKVGGVTIPEPHYVSPFSSYTFPLPKGADGKVSWSIVNDYGGRSKVYQADLK